MIAFHYKDSQEQRCYGEIEILSGREPLELEVNANGWMFHVITGKHDHGGRYLCIPNWNIGSELAKLNDEFWNEERLLGYTALHPDNVRAVVKALAVTDRWMKDKESERGG
ncbi:MAG: hypothetical protein J6M27_05270 [Lachnospiraceae bacterium]|jgi:hypothetical protein|nr:hypothetical protein [Lachnospiraceae bacterium]